MATRLSAFQLKQLTNGTRVNIKYRKDDTQPAGVVFESIPKTVLTHFAPFFEDTLVVTGGNKDVLKSILKWMTSCCTGRGMVRYPTPSKLPLVTYIEVGHMINIIGEGSDILDDLREEMLERCTAISATQIPINDVRALYESDSQSSIQARDQVVESIGNAIVCKRLQYPAYYYAFKDENEEFGSALDKYIATTPQAMAVQAKWQAGKAAFDARKAAKTAAALAKYQARQAEREAKNKAVWEANQAAWEARQAARNAEPVIKTETVSMVANKKGQVKLSREDLARMGVKF